MSTTVDRVTRERDGNGTGTFGRTLALLDLVAASQVPLRFTDILAISGEPRATLHRQLSHLVEEGLLVQRRDLSYEPGLRLLTLAHRAWSRNTLRAVAAPHLQRLHDITGETVHLGVLRAQEIVYIDKVESRQAVRMESHIGNASPLYCTGLGKAILSVLPSDMVAKMLGRLTFHPFTPNTHLSIASLEQDLAQTAECGYAFDRQEHQAEIQCVAAAIHDERLDFVAGVSVTAPAYRAPMEQLRQWSVPVCEAARAIAADAVVGLGPSR